MDKSRKFFGIITLFILIIGVILKGNYGQRGEEEPEVANHIQVTHFQCKGSGFKTSKIYSIGEIENCRMAPEDIDVAYTQALIYQKTHLRQLEATRCEVKRSKLIFHCGQYSHSIIKRDEPTITYHHYLTADECKKAAETGNIQVEWRGSKYDIPMGNGTHLISTHVSGKEGKEDDDINCKGYALVYKYTFDTFMRKINLTYNSKNEEVLSYQGFELPCKYCD